MIRINTKSWPYIRWTDESLSSQAIGYIALMTVLMCNGTFTPFAKGLTSALSPISILFLGEILILFFVFFSFGFIKIIKEVLTINTKFLSPLCSLGILTSLGAVLLFTGLQTTDAANAELFVRSEVIFLVIFAALVLKEKITRTHLMSGGIILLGIAVVSFRGFTEAYAFRMGDILILSAACSLSIASIIFKKYLATLKPEIVIFFRSGTAIVIFFLFSPFVEQTLIEEIGSMPSSIIPALLGFGFVSRFLSILSFYSAVERLKVSTISMTIPFAIILSILFAHVYLGEQIFWYHMVGGALILLGTLLMHIIGVHPSEKDIQIHMKQHHRHHL
jgi:drug/metabolite transporter (DMT)-like permease